MGRLNTYLGRPGWERLRAVSTKGKEQVRETGSRAKAWKGFLSLPLLSRRKGTGGRLGGMGPGSPRKGKLSHQTREEGRDRAHGRREANLGKKKDQGVRIPAHSQF